MIGVLHTWGSQLSYHPHLHTIVTTGGWDDRVGAWKDTPKGAPFFAPVKVMGRLFRGVFLRSLREAWENGSLYLGGCAAGLDDHVAMGKLLRALWEKEWVVYAKHPFGGVQSVVEYLARYTHRVAIADSRITLLKEDEVRFIYKDYSAPGTDGGPVPQKEMSLAPQEFIRRFALHVLPEGFQKIRYYGILASAARAKRDAARKKLAHRQFAVTVRTVKQILLKLIGIDPDVCPACGCKNVTCTEIPPDRLWFDRQSPTGRAPPAED